MTLSDLDATAERAEKWYWVDMKWACGAVIVSGGIVIDCAPIFRKMLLGQPWTPARRWAVREL